MAETKDQVRAEIEQTRAQLGATIDAIARVLTDAGHADRQFPPQAVICG